MPDEHLTTRTTFPLREPAGGSSFRRSRARQGLTPRIQQRDATARGLGPHEMGRHPPHRGRISREHPPQVSTGRVAQECRVSVPSPSAIRNEPPMRPHVAAPGRAAPRRRRLIPPSGPPAQRRNRRWNLATPRSRRAGPPPMPLVPDAPIQVQRLRSTRTCTRTRSGFGTPMALGSTGP